MENDSTKPDTKVENGQCAGNSLARKENLKEELKRIDKQVNLNNAFILKATVTHNNRCLKF